MVYSAAALKLLARGNYGGFRSFQEDQLVEFQVLQGAKGHQAHNVIQVKE